MPLLYKTVTKSSGAALGLTFLSRLLCAFLVLKLMISPRYLVLRDRRILDCSIEVYMGFLP